MKSITIICLLVSGILNTGYMQTQPDQSADHSIVKFKETRFNFGTVPYGSDVSHTFVFKNISKERMCIRDVHTSCGCTTPKYSSDPVKPGRKGLVTAKYDSSRPGPFEKTLTVMVSDGEQVVLTIMGEIGPKPVEKGATGTK